MEEHISEVENGVENLQRRMSTSLGKDMVANSSETQTSMGASMEVTNETYDSLGKNVNLRKRSLDSPEGGQIVKKQESYLRLEKRFGWKTVMVPKHLLWFILKQIAK